jgi:hypothetical protein
VAQLTEGGYLLLPVDKGREQILYRYQRRGQEVVIERSVSCRFVPLLPGVQEAPTDVAEAPEAAAADVAALTDSHPDTNEREQGNTGA